MENILEVNELSKKYPDFELKNVSLTVPKGCIVGLIGENGAGKSTTIKSILGLIKKDGGSVSFMGSELSPDIKEDIGVVFDELSFYQTMTPAKVGRVMKAAYKQWDEAVYSGYLSRFGIPPKKEIKTFSKGMKMKLGIAAALSHAPKLLILDEATAGLDPVMRDDIIDVFLDFVQDEERSIIMSSHITTDLERAADYIVFIHEGQILFSKPKDELRYKYGIVRCREADLLNMDKADILAYRKEEYQTSVLVADRDYARRKYKNAVIDDASIDDIMLMYVKGRRVS